MKLFLATVLLLSSGIVSPAHAVIFYSTADPTFNTSAPTGALAGSGWQWVGSFDGFTGTPIAPGYFLAAHHIQGNVGDTFVFNGVSYTTTAFFDDTVSDLRIWQINGTFPAWAPIYRGSGEAGRGLVVFGYGLGRGSEILANGSLAGWRYGSGGGTLRWGQNTIRSVVNGGSYWGQLLYALFDASSNVNQCDLATGDSSGPVFINDGSGWQLAGIAAAVDAYFNTTTSGNGFIAAIFDARGLYYGSTGNWNLVAGSSPVPTGFYATQISARAAWIDSIVTPPADSPLFSGAQGAILAAGLLAGGVCALRSRVLREERA